ncbi:hypothetical protein R1flu_008298 [Riccia fluitans]|uniref:Uncharacterized protein n=1 Tax=Riccia fluitans TaxID=41844 RepID=A0ABD1YBB0_9MARC
MDRKSKREQALDTKVTVDFNEWGVLLHNRGRETSKLFEALHVNVTNVSMEEAACNMERTFVPPPAVKTMDIQPWKEMVKNLVSLLIAEWKRNREVVEQYEYFEGKVRRLEKVPEIAMWCA